MKREKVDEFYYYTATYWCTKCKRSHKRYTKIGKEHLKYKK